MKNFSMLSMWSLLLVCALLPMTVMSQEATTSSQPNSENTIEGTVVTSTRDTLVVRTQDNQFHLFVFDRDTVKPRSVATGSRVSVMWTPGEEEGVKLASLLRC